MPFCLCKMEYIFLHLSLILAEFGIAVSLLQLLKKVMYVNVIRISVVILVCLAIFSPLINKSLYSENYAIYLNIIQIFLFVSTITCVIFRIKYRKLFLILSSLYIIIYCLLSSILLFYYCFTEGLFVLLFIDLFFLPLALPLSMWFIVLLQKTTDVMKY